MAEGETRYPDQLDGTDNLPSIVGYDMLGTPLSGGDVDPNRNAENLLGVIAGALLALQGKVGRATSTPSNGYVLRGGSGGATTWTAPSQIAATIWGPGTGTAGQVLRVAAGGTTLEFADATPADGTVTNAKVAADAAIAESKLNLASDAAAATPSRRTLGTGATQAAAGNDARLTNTRTPTDGTVTDAKVAADAAIAESKLNLASDAAAGTPSRRSLGSGATQAAPGNHSGHVAAQAAIADLSATISNPPTQAEVADIQDKVNAILAALRTAGVLQT